MIRNTILFALMLISSIGFGQELKVEFDKNRDFSQYKTFRFGEGEIITPKDQQQSNEKDIEKWIRNAIRRELEMRALTLVDSSSDLVVSYVAGSLARSATGDVGPMGLTPGSNDRTYIRDYRQGSLIIDLNDRSKLLVWRINATSDMSATGGERMIGQIVEKGFRKYPKPTKKKKK
ncbi:MAG: DUF4136 domain-containing protein [Cyclobacteriaceae bacterium]|nr:DUF4136 domain-containing protein [Cyclobacteriaceae bacterium]